MHYTSHVDVAFSSVEHIMRDVEGGWLLCYMHANGASMCCKSLETLEGVLALRQNQVRMRVDSGSSPLNGGWRDGVVYSGARKQLTWMRNGHRMLGANPSTHQVLYSRYGKDIDMRDLLLESTPRCV
ncbi:hypothetical protein RND71_025138 [Anisodus tanguticus]|uniref:Cytochrome b/b6 N-terminal region profile domain-containing protein n=1 Tax=Anisodus tanguticus TaxID=243964 RepID=A0AAE1V5I8_9SOLA|nr:hypothetical protein RND71_025138 [Anisodus tanguticus]